MVPHNRGASHAIVCLLDRINLLGVSPCLQLPILLLGILFENRWSITFMYHDSRRLDQRVVLIKPCCCRTADHVAITASVITCSSTDASPR